MTTRGHTPPEVHSVLTKLDAIAATVDTTFSEQADAARARLAPVLAQGKAIRQALEQFADDNRPWLEALARKISLADLDHVPALRRHRERIGAVVGEVLSLLGNVPEQLRGAERRAAALTGREANLLELEGQIGYAVTSVQTVHTDTLPPLLARVRWMLKELEAEPDFVHIVTQLGAVPTPSAPGPASHATTAFSR